MGFGANIAALAAMFEAAEAPWNAVLSELNANVQLGPQLSYDTAIPGYDMANTHGDRTQGIYSLVLSGDTLAVTTLLVGVSHGESTIVEWDQIYDRDRPWASDGLLVSHDRQSVMTHEFGHVLGLEHPSGRASCARATMYSEIARGDTTKRTLSCSDQRAIQTLYADATDTQSTSGATTTRAFSSFFWTLSLLLIYNVM